jgi:hypothetical protein
MVGNNITTYIQVVIYLPDTQTLALRGSLLLAGRRGYLRGETPQGQERVRDFDLTEWTDHRNRARLSVFTPNLLTIAYTP